MQKRSALRYNEAVAHDGTALCAAIGPTSGLVLATGGDDCSVNVWRLGKPHVIASFRDFKKPATCVCFSAQDANLAAGSESGAVKVWSMARGKVSCSFAAHRSAVTCLSFHPRVEHVLASGGADGRVQVLDASTPPGTILNTYTYVPPTRARAAVVTAAPITCISFSPPGNWLAAGDESGRVIVWDTGRGVQLLAWDGASPGGAAVHNLVSATVGAAPTLGGMSSASAASGPGHRGSVTCLAFHPEEFILVSGGEDRIVRVWDCDPRTTQPLLAITPTDTGPIRSLLFLTGLDDTPSSSAPSSVRWPLAVITDTRLRVWHVAGVTDERTDARGEVPVTTDVLSVAWPGVSAAWVGSIIRASAGNTASPSHIVVVSLRHSFMTAHGVDARTLVYLPPVPVVKAARMASPEPTARAPRPVRSPVSAGGAQGTERGVGRERYTAGTSGAGSAEQAGDRSIPSGVQLSGTPVYSVAVSREAPPVQQDEEVHGDDQFSVGESEAGEEAGYAGEEAGYAGEEQQAKMEWARAQAAQTHVHASSEPSASRWADLPASPPLVTRVKSQQHASGSAGVEEGKAGSPFEGDEESKSESSSERLGEEEGEADLVPSASSLHKLSVFHVDQEAGAGDDGKPEAEVDEEPYSPDADHIPPAAPIQQQLLISPKRSPARRRAPAAAVDLGALQAVMDQVAAVKQAMEQAKRAPAQAGKGQQDHKLAIEQQPINIPLPLPPPAYPGRDVPATQSCTTDGRSLPAADGTALNVKPKLAPSPSSVLDSAPARQHAPLYDPALGSTMVGGQLVGLGGSVVAAAALSRAPGDFVPCVRDAPAGLAFEAFLPDATPCGFGTARREPLGATRVQTTRAGSAAAMRGGSSHGGRSSPTDHVLTAVRAKRAMFIETLARRQSSVRVSAAAWIDGDVRKAMNLASTAADAGAMADILSALTGLSLVQDPSAASDLFAKGSARVEVSAPAVSGAGTSPVETLMLNLEQAAAIMHLAHAAMSDAAPLWQSVGIHAAFSMFRAYSPIIRSLVTTHLGPLPTDQGSLPLDTVSLAARNLDPTVEERLERAGYAASALEAMRRRAGSMLKGSGAQQGGTGVMERSMAGTLTALIRGYDSWRSGMAAD